MTENSTTNVYQVCQANQDCYYSILGQICLGNRCIFSCNGDLDCPSNGKCLSNNCDWSGKPIPPISPSLSPNMSQKNLDTDNGGYKLNSPIVIAAIIMTLLLIIFGVVILCFFVFRRRDLAKSSRGLKPLHLSGSRTSLRKSKRDSREKERVSKNFQHDDIIGSEIGSDDEGKEDFEESYSPAAVGSGTHRPPVRSQTMYGTSTPSTIELNVTDYDYPPVLQQSTHFMASPDDEQLQQQHHHYMEGDDNQQQ
ncbi:hypothetical protein C1645_835032 [Glomus cerebriforme]|uniref:Uncharacterized protein n=1 Tax=Glomus cerebriforme TaxID=658196 RepID=A0A397SIL4_9GLOM|nr:hypothetical protein C1645_835032 [Glomus cerebriforme]